MGKGLHLQVASGAHGSATFFRPLLRTAIMRSHVAEMLYEYGKTLGFLMPERSAWSFASLHCMWSDFGIPWLVLRRCTPWDPRFAVSYKVVQSMLLARLYTPSALWEWYIVRNYKLHSELSARRIPSKLCRKLAKMETP